jgi:hypothetical protein
MSKQPPATDQLVVSDNLTNPAADVIVTCDYAEAAQRVLEGLPHRKEPARYRIVRIEKTKEVV